MCSIFDTLFTFLRGWYKIVMQAMIAQFLLTFNLEK